MEIQLEQPLVKVNTNFTELYGQSSCSRSDNLVLTMPGGATIQQSIIGSLIGEDSTAIIDHSNNTIVANKIDR